jgi:hypothetical protein
MLQIVQSFSLQPHPRGVDKSRASEPFPRYCSHPLPLRFYACLTRKNLAYWTIEFFLLINHLAPSYLASPFMCWFARLYTVVSMFHGQDLLQVPQHLKYCQNPVKICFNGKIHRNTLLRSGSFS